ncbi:MAG: site-2 protease family protein [Pyrobaculum sp.]
MLDPDLRKREIFDIAVSLVVLSLGFSFAMSGRGLLSGGVNWGRVFYVLPLAFITLLFAFVGHELAHRQVAKRLGYIAYYSADYQLLPLAVILPLLIGVVFAAPGAVVISPYKLYGRGDEKKDVFLIASAGPLTNIIFAALGYMLSTSAGGLPAAFLAYFAFVNAWLAFFNLWPIPPLDGSKVIRTNPTAWAFLIVVAGLLVWLLW